MKALLIIHLEPSLTIYVYMPDFIGLRARRFVCVISPVVFQCDLGREHLSVCTLYTPVGYLQFITSPTTQV